MSIFGWSYPPGCSGPPDDDYPCAVCGNQIDDCVCPECQVCNTYGDPACYDSEQYHHTRFPFTGKSHGMIETNEQITSMVKCEEAWRLQAESENEMLKEMEEDIFS